MKVYINKFCVYAHYVDGKCIYVGKGTPARAMDRRRGDLYNETVAENNFELDVRFLRWFYSLKESLDFERKLIQKLKPKCNKHFNGFHASEYTKLRISLANTGRKHTEEEREKMRGKRAPLSQKHKLALSLALKGKGRIGQKHSQEAIEKMRKARKLQAPPMLGRHHSKKSREKMRISSMLRLDRRSHS